MYHLNLSSAWDRIVFLTSATLPSTAHAGNADMIQPGLIPLQPNLDFMDSFDPLQGSRGGAPPISAVVLHIHTNFVHFTVIMHTCSCNSAVAVCLA